MKYFGQVVNMTGRDVAGYLHGHPKKFGSVAFQPNERSEVYPILDEELVVRLLDREVGKAKLFKIPFDNCYSILIIIEIT